jgi:integrase
MFGDKGKKNDRACKPPSQEQAQKVREGAKGDRSYLLYVLAIHRGVRRGELLGLQWDDVDLDAGKLSVRRTLSETGPKFEKPKNGKGRLVELSPTAIKLL